MVISVAGIILLIVGSVFISLVCVMAGGWLVFKGKAAPGEGFIRAPKGEVFTVADPAMVEDYPDEPNHAEENVLKRTERFLKSLKG